MICFPHFQLRSRLVASVAWPVCCATCRSVPLYLVPAALTWNRQKATVASASILKVCDVKLKLKSLSRKCLLKRGQMTHCVGNAICMTSHISICCFRFLCPRVAPPSSTCSSASSLVSNKVSLNFCSIQCYLYNTKLQQPFCFRRTSLFQRQRYRQNKDHLSWIIMGLRLSSAHPRRWPSINQGVRQSETEDVHQ